MNISSKKLVLLLLFCTPSQADFSALWQQQWAVDNNGHGQKFETLFKPQWQTSLTDDISMTFIPQLRLDSQSDLGSSKDKADNYSSINGPLLSNDDAQLTIREWYFDTEYLGAFWRVGKQQVVWGQADGLKVLDVVNPQSYREFILDDFEDSRIPLWMLNVDIPIGEDDSLQVLWILDQTYHENARAGSTYAVTSPLFVPQLPDGVSLTGFNQQKPRSVLSDSDLGLRYSLFYQGWDLTFNYLYHYQDSSVLYQSHDDQGVAINAVFERNHLVGATASNVFDEFTLRTEVGYSSDTYHLSADGIVQSSDLSFVIGLDWQGLEDTLISVQWFQSYLFDHQDSVIRPQSDNKLSLMYKRTFANETWALEMLAVQGFDQDDGLIQSKLSYLLESNIKLMLGSDVFYGDKTELFGQFDNQDRFTVGFEWGF
jgi:hypothetical protein